MHTKAKSERLYEEGRFEVQMAPLEEEMILSLKHNLR